jgi:hypothetical protein
MVHASQKQIIYIFLSNSIINKEYREFFPFSDLSIDYEIRPIFGKTIFTQDQKFVQVRFFKFTRKIHAIIHYCIMWHRRFSSLAFKLRAYQYFGTKNEIIAILTLESTECFIDEVLACGDCRLEALLDVSS